MNKLRTVRLYGKLGSRFGRVFKLAVDTPAEAVRALCAQLPGLQPYLVQGKDRGEGYSVFVGKRNLSEDELGVLAGEEDIRIAPVILGSKNGSWFQVILGAVLVVVGMMSVVVDYSGTLATALVGAGISMMVGGVVQLLTPTTRKGNEREQGEQPSYTFSGPVNTHAQGNPVPVLYGEMIIGSAVISAGIRAEGVAVPGNWGTGGGTGGHGGLGHNPWGGGGGGGFRKDPDWLYFEGLDAGEH